ncbi:MAG: WD40 repeat domain-containing protein [Tenuifilaceae bacterium]
MKKYYWLFIIIINSVMGMASQNPFPKKNIGFLTIGHKTEIIMAEFSPDSKLLLTSSYDCVVLWNIETLKPIKQWDGESNGVFNQEGTLVATTLNDGSIKIRDVKTRKEMRVIKGENIQITKLKFSPDSKLIVSLQEDNISRLYDISSGLPIDSFDAFNDWLEEMNNLAIFSESGEKVIARYNNVVFGSNNLVLIETQSNNPFCGFSLEDWNYWGYIIWNLTENKLIISGNRVLVSANGSWIYQENEANIIYNDEYLGDTIFNSLTNEVLYTFTNERLIGKADHDPNIIAVTTRTNFLNRYDTLKIIDLESKRVLHNLDKTREYEYNHAAFSHDDSLLVASNFDGQVKLYNLKTGEKIKSLDRSIKGINSLQFSPDKKWVMISTDSIQLWNTNKGKLHFTFPLESKQYTNVSFSPNGKWVITTEGKNSASLFDVKKGQFIHQFEN